MGRINELYMMYKNGEDPEKVVTVKAAASNRNTPKTEDELFNEYFEWLTRPLQQIKSEQKYDLLLRRLHTIDFLWSVPNDDNRGLDGVQLREDFIDKSNLDIYCWSLLLNRPCTVLEMLIALSIRIEDIMDDMGESSNPDGWFWEMIQNLGLLYYTDEYFYRLGGPMEVPKIVGVMLSRGYGRDGRGGLFPLRRPNLDQRKVELWYQMNAYLHEKYHADGGSA